MSHQQEVIVPIHTGSDVVRARLAVGALAEKMPFTIVERTKLVTAVSELARNTLIHGGGGSSPGIPDLDLAFTDGWTSGSGMGLGLSGARRLLNDFTLTSTPDKGTTITGTTRARNTQRR